MILIDSSCNFLNILLDYNGHVKVADFGTALDETKREQGADNVFCGTAQYVSPEVLEDRPANKGCDLWALGCIAYQVCCILSFCVLSCFVVVVVVVIVADFSLSLSLPPSFFSLTLLLVSYWKDHVSRCQRIHDVSTNFIIPT